MFHSDNNNTKPTNELQTLNQNKTSNDSKTLDTIHGTLPSSDSFDTDINQSAELSSDEGKIDLSLKRNFGSNLPLFYCKGEPLITVGPDWTYFVVTYLICLFIFIIMYTLKLNHINFILKYFYITYFAFFSINYILLCFINQGIPTEKKGEASKKPNDYLQCAHCHTIVHKDYPYITFHCEICNVCVEDFDHHCPFATKCVGKGNKRYFNVFIITLPILILLNIVYIFI